MPVSDGMIDPLEANRWMPPSPHRERVLELIAAGRAHIEEQGHGKPPLLVHEDGGLLELPLVRVGANDIVAESRPEGPTRLTKHSDVCAGVDEIEAWLKEDPAGLQADPERLRVLLEDALYMARRMQRRRQAYQRHAERVAAVAARMGEIVGPDCTHLESEAQAITEAAGAGQAVTPEGAEAIVAHAEAIREVANSLEATLRKYRDAATELAALFQDIKGARNWESDVGERLAALRAAQ